MKKTILTLIAFITLLTSVTLIPANAAIADPGETVMPLWDNTATIHLAIDFNPNGYGYAEATVIGVPGVTKIVVDIQVFRQYGTSWVSVAEKEITVNSLNGLFSCPFVPVEGAYYKADYTITVSKNNVDEIINKTIYDTCE